MASNIPVENFKSPFFSIIIPTCERIDRLERAVNSVLTQTFDNWELLIVDDNNEDSPYRESIELLANKSLNCKKIKYLKHLVNKGGSAARNTGIQNATGNYIAFLDDDDYWDKRKLELFAREIEKTQDDYGVWFSGFYIVTPNFTFISHQPIADGDISKKQLYEDNVSSTSAVVVKKECFEKSGLFDEQLPARQDYDMWLRISEFYLFKYINAPLTYVYREDDAGAISSKLENSLKGTLIVLNKIKDRIDKCNSKEKKAIYSSQYRFLGLRYCEFKKFSLGRKYFLKSFIKKMRISTFFYIILSIFGCEAWRFFVLIKRRLHKV